MEEDWSGLGDGDVFTQNIRYKLSDTLKTMPTEQGLM
jgi:hypothetical protein